MPTKNGDTIAASAVVLYARPLCCPENFSVCSRYVPIVTYHAPQTKYSRNIITDSLIRIVEFILGVPRVSVRCALRTVRSMPTRRSRPPVALWRPFANQRGRASPPIHELPPLLRAPAR